MVGRRQLREKIIQSLYSYHQNPIKLDILEKNMFAEIEKIFSLYVYELNFLVALKDLAEAQIEISKNKFIKVKEDENPNLKFIQNRVLLNLEENRERLEHTSKHKKIVWDRHDELLVKTYQRLTQSKRYKEYMSSGEDNFLEDQIFIGKLFLRYVAENDSLQDRVEGMEIYWADDIHIANSMVQKTIGFMKDDTPSNTLIRIIKDEEDRSFARQILRSAVNNQEDLEKRIGERLDNWEWDRVSVMDKIILMAALSEMDSFRTTPSNIIINEYIEIAKAFSSEKSNIFVNGILDKYAKESGRI